jgi:hypothetical protein
MQHVIGMFDSRTQAAAAIERLKALGIGADAISVAAMQEEPDGTDLAEAAGVNDMAGEGSAVGAVSGAAVGTLVGLLVAGSTIALPGVGTFLVAGPLAAALTGAGIGAASGGLLGALVGSGIPEAEATHYLEGVRSGRVVVAANVDDLLANEVRNVFDEEGSMRTHAV